MKYIISPLLRLLYVLFYYSFELPLRYFAFILSLLWELDIIETRRLYGIPPYIWKVGNHFYSDTYKEEITYVYQTGWDMIIGRKTVVDWFYYKPIQKSK